MLDGVSTALPSTLEAFQLTSRAARVGFDWPDASGALDKAEEELRELRAAGHDSRRAQEEVGDLLMAAAIEQADRWLGVLRLELTVYADNTRAIALYRRHGFEMEGTLRAFALRDGVYVDAYAMARIHPRPPVPVATPATP